MLEFNKIDLPFATDIIAEKFDNILELMSPSAFVYGGALRDIAAGFTLEGDLDIVAAGTSYLTCIDNISKSGKWRNKNTSLDMIVKRIRQPNYAFNKTINKISRFETFGNTQVEIIDAKIPFPENNITAELNVIKTVDIRCCGMAMDRYGNVYEILKGAHQDCLDRVLKLSNLNTNSNIENLISRIAKLKKRGWASKINIKRASKALDKIKDAAHKEHSERMSKMALYDDKFMPEIVTSNEGDRLIVSIHSVDNTSISFAEFKRIIGEIVNVGGIKTTFNVSVNHKSDIFIEFNGVRGDFNYKYMDKLSKIVTEGLNAYFKYEHKRHRGWPARKGGILKRHSKDIKSEPKFKRTYTKYATSTPSNEEQDANIAIAIPVDPLELVDPPEEVEHGQLYDEPIGEITRHVGEVVRNQHKSIDKKTTIDTIASPAIGNYCLPADTKGENTFNFYTLSTNPTTPKNKTCTTTPKNKTRRGIKVTFNNKTNVDEGGEKVNMDESGE